MAECPKCGRHLRLIDWKQHCPDCGANIFVYDLQERWMQDADKAEVQHYYFQKKVDRVKGAFIGSPLAIARIFTSILPVGPLFLALANAKFTQPFTEYEGKLTIMEIYKNIGEVTKIFDFFGSGNKADLMLALSVIFLVLSLVATVLHFALNTLACSPKGKIRNTIINIIYLASTVAAIVLFAMMGDGGCVTGTLGIGAYLYLVAQIINAGLDFVVLIKGIEIKHAQCYCGGIPIEEYFELVEKGWTQEQLRAEQYKRLQAIWDESEAKKAEEEMKKEAEGNG